MGTEKPGFNDVIAGALSGFLTRCICQPLDVIKIQFQLQVEPISHRHPSKYQSFSQTILTIIKEEGLSALWKGHIPAQMLSISYGMLQFYCYRGCVELLTTKTKPDQWQHLMQFVAGAGAGTIATIVCFPLDSARTRLVAQSSNHKIYKGMISYYVMTLRTEPLTSLFRGLSPTLLQVAPNTGLQFVIYNAFRDIYKKLSKEDRISTTNTMISGSFAGLLSKTLVYPLDVMKKRMQIQGFEHGRRGFGEFFFCQGFMECLLRICKREGIMGLYKGLFPSQIKAVITSALHFTFYEQSLIVLRNMGYWV